MNGVAPGDRREVHLRLVARHVNQVVRGAAVTVEVSTEDVAGLADLEVLKEGRDRGVAPAEPIPRVGAHDPGAAALISGTVTEAGEVGVAGVLVVVPRTEGDGSASTVLVAVP